MPALIELTDDECEHLLRRGTFGRVVLTTPHGPDIVPVNYVVEGHSVVVRTAPDGMLARYGDGATLLFEVDLVDEERWHGWSVVARGRGSVADAGPVAAARVRPWAAGHRAREVRIAWDELSGRRVGTGWDLQATMYSRRDVR